MRWPASTLLLAIVLVGCAHTVGGSARAAMSALKILPAESEITDAVGTSLSTFGFEPSVGGAEILPDGYRTEADASPIGCVTVTDTAPRVVYESAAVAEAARQSYFNWDEGVETSGADAAVVRLSTPGAADGAFSRIAEQWRQCDGVTVVKQLRGADGGPTDSIEADVAQVGSSGSMLSATVRTRQGSDLPESLYERALGVRNDTIVEVSLAITPSGEQQAVPRAGAVSLAEAMLDKVVPPP